MAAADAVCAGVGADGDVAMCGDNSFDPAAAAPFSTTDSTLQNVFLFVSTARFTLKKKK